MEVKYLKDNHQVLVKNKIYKVHSKVDDGIMVVISTGFCGIPDGDYKEINEV